ncbi:hypothetical protein TNCV_3717341 [Trichonephila clavipes]|nr:hypothetical protein TNCV_3717341 [Trichonephila clavipes]
MLIIALPVIELYWLLKHHLPLRVISDDAAGLGSVQIRYLCRFQIHRFRTRGHGTTVLRMKEDIEDVSSELEVALLGGNIQYSIALGELGSNKTSSRFMTIIKMC